MSLEKVTKRIFQGIVGAGIILCSYGALEMHKADLNNISNDNAIERINQYGTGAKLVCVGMSSLGLYWFGYPLVRDAIRKRKK